MMMMMMMMMDNNTDNMYIRTSFAAETITYFTDKISK